MKTNLFLLLSILVMTSSSYAGGSKPCNSMIVEGSERYVSYQDIVIEEHLPDMVGKNGFLMEDNIKIVDTVSCGSLVNITLSNKGHTTGIRVKAVNVLRYSDSSSVTFSSGGFNRFMPWAGQKITFQYKPSQFKYKLLFIVENLDGGNLRAFSSGGIQL
jgi:hypothetical protein